MNGLKQLKAAEKEMLLKFPAFISLLAANHEDSRKKREINYAIKYAHIKTFSCNPLLSEFYAEADKVFKRNIEQLNQELPEGKKQREKAISDELVKIQKILVKLGRDYARALHRSMLSFKDHVSRSNRNVLEYFIFPIPLNGIIDRI